MFPLSTTERHYWLGDQTLVYDNPQARYLVDADDVTAVTRHDESIYLERGGWRPALTIDTDDLDDPDAVEAALSRLSGRPVRRS